MLRSGKLSDKAAIKSLWKRCFFDSDDYIDLYLNNKFIPENTVILELENEIIGMTHLIPCTLLPNKKAFYWYAVCIDENHRGKGYFRFMVENILKETQKRGYANLCVPAPGLEHVYQKLGFHNPYFCSEKYFTRNDKNESTICFTSACPKDFEFLIGEEGSTAWTIQDYEYAFKENEFSGGQQIKFEISDKEYFLFAIRKEDYYLIDYHNIEENVFSEIIDSLMNFLNCNFVLFRTEGKDKIIGLSDSDLVNTHSKITMNLG